MDIRLSPYVSLIILSLLLSTTWGYAQKELKFEVIDHSSGLSTNSVSTLIQDSRGLIWFGTRDGLNKYDGVKIEEIKFSEENNIITSIYESRDSTLWIGIASFGLVHYNPITLSFFVYQHESENPAGLSSNTITFIHEDQQGNIWVSTNSGGLEQLDLKTETFKSFQNIPNKSGNLSSTNVSYFCEDPMGNIWVGTAEGDLNLLAQNQTGFNQIELGNEKYEGINIIFSGPKNTIWVGTTQGLYKIKEIKEEEYAITKIDHLTNVTSIWVDQHETLWVASGDQLCKYNGIENKFELVHTLLDHEIIPNLISRNPSVFNSNNVYQTNSDCQSVLVDFNNKFWMITNKGLDIFDPSTGYLKEVRSNDNFTNFNSNQINSMLIDNSGLLWFSTIGGGINKYYHSSFSHYQHKINIENSLGNAFVLNFHENEDGTIWVATNGGNFSLFNTLTQNFKRYKIPNTESIIFDIYQYKDHLWIATSGTGLVRFDLKTEKFKFYKNNPIDPTSISSDNIQKLFADSRGNFWVGSENGINLFDPINETFKLIDLKDQLSIQPDVFAIKEFHGELWLGTLGQGLIKLDRENPGNSKIFGNLEGDSRMRNDYVTSIHNDINNPDVFWIGTYGGGLVKLNEPEQTFTHFTTENGLPNNVIYGVLQDTTGFLWFSSNGGITKFNTETEEVISKFDVDDGLQSNEFNRGAYLMTKNGNMLFGGINGFNYFNPNEVIQDSFTPKVLVTSFKLFGEPVSEIQEKINQNMRVDLDHDQNFLSIEFATLDYRNPKKNQYRYRLSGLTEIWTEVDYRNPIASFSNLSPGNYVFELASSNSDGIWLEENSTIKIFIQPPFWESFYFKVFILAIIVAIALSIHFSRVRILTRRQVRLNQMVQSKTQELEEKAALLNNANKEISHSNEELKSTLEQLQDTQKRLIESEKMASLGVLSAGVGHEINNPLNFIKGGIDLLSKHLMKGKGNKDKDLDHYISIVSEGVDRASEIVKSLGHFSRKAEDLNEDCDIHVILDNCLIILQGKFKKKVVLEKDYTSSAVITVGNEGRLHQSFLNILSNAEQAIIETGIIKISTETTAKKIKVKISDTGSGIKQDYLARIWEPFYTTKPPGQGTGLGLSITYSIIQEHHGSISVKSELNKGSEFTIELPSK